MMDKDRGHFIKEGADYMRDIPSNWRRREIAAHKIPLKDDYDDESYRVFLEELYPYCYTHPKSLSNSAAQLVEAWFDKENTEDAIDSDDFPGVIDEEYTEGVDLDRRSMGSFGEEDDYDPDVEMFLQNLKPCGFAYVLDISIGSFIEQIKYEDEDEDEDKQRDESRRKVHKSNPSDRISQPIQKRSHLVKEPKILNYEVNRISPTNRVKQTKRSPKKSTSIYNKRKGSYKEKNEAPTPRSSSRKFTRKGLVEDSSSDYSQEEPIQRQSHVLPKRREPPIEYPPVKHREGKREKEVQISLSKSFSKNYLQFLKGYKMVGDSPVYEDEKGNKYTWEERYDESSSDPDVIVLDSPSKRMTPKPSKKRLQSSESNRLMLTPEPSKKRCLLSGPNIVIDPSSKYRKMLMEVLLKPYDEIERLDLWEKANVRKPIMRHRDMRGKSCSYPDDSLLAPSYLDRYRDLNREIKAVQPDEPHKELHLLRGLFFYLKYVCMENEFVPWTDRSWMKAVRESKRH